MNDKYRWLGLLMLVFFAVACNPGSNPDVACDPQGCISLSKFAGNIFTALQGNVVGEAIMVGGTFPLTGGLARTTADPPSYAMNIQTPINIASTSKVLTTVGVLQSLAKHNLTVADKIAPYLWSDWQKGPNVNTITFRDLLTHRAGFRDNCDSTYAGLKQQIKDGVTLANKAIPFYDNCNFSIFREMLPFMEGESYNGNEAGRAQWSADYYVKYMIQHVFKPVGVGDQACKPDPNNVALSYPFPAGSVHGTDWGDSTLVCGAGGWVLSADDLYYVVYNIANGNVLLTNAERTQMDAPYPDSLGWDASLTDDICPNPYVCKNGGLDGGSDIHVRAYIGIFKCNVPVVVVVNSNLPGSDPTPLVKTAYQNAVVSGTAGPCSAQPPMPAPPIPPALINPSQQPSPTSPPTATTTPLPIAPVLTVQPILELTPTRVVPIERPSATQTPLQIQPKPTATHTATQTPVVLKPPLQIEPKATASQTPRDTVAPRPPILVAPINGVSVDCGQVTLKWKSADDASGIRDYDVELQKQVERTFVAERTWNNTKGDSVDLSPTCNTVFRWRARATDNKGNQGNWSDYEEFFVRAAIR